MSPRAPAQGGLWGRQQPAASNRKPGYAASNDLELFAAVAAMAIDPGYVLIGPAERVLRRDPAHKSHVEPVASYEAAMVAQMLDTGHLTIGGSHHVIYGRHDGPARSVLVPKATREHLTCWSNLHRLPTQRQELHP